MATDETLDVQLQDVKAQLKIIYSKKFDETKGGNDEKRAACCAIHDQLKPSELCPSEFPTEWANRDARNVNLMATPEKQDGPLQKEQVVVANSEMFEETPGRENKKGAAGRTHESGSTKARASRKLKYPTTQSPVIKSGRTDQETPKEESPSESPTPQSSVINFKSGRNTSNREALKEELYKAVESVARKKSAAKKSIKTFVNSHIHEMLGPESVSLSQLPQYISCKVIELSLAGQVVWETEDGKAAEGTTDFWKFKYSERRLIEAAQLYSSCKTRNVPMKKEELLPVMYWREEAEGDTTSYNWAESSRTEDGGEMLGKGRSPPTWAIAHIERIENVLGEDMQVFRKDEVGEPNKHPNAVYLLLCRFNGMGVPEDASIQAYAGRAEHGVANRWLSHAGASKSVMEKYRRLKTFCAEPLTINPNKPKPRYVQLVDVIVSRLYAQGGRDYITEMDDNIVLFVYRAYGTGHEKEMAEAEKDLIKKLNLTDMKCGMNGCL